MKKLITQKRKSKVFMDGLHVKVERVNQKDGLIVIPVVMVNVNLVVERKVKAVLNILLVDLHHLLVNLKVKVNPGERKVN